MIIKRQLADNIALQFDKLPVTAILGPRQVGKSTLSKHIISNYPQSIYLDLELEKDRNVLSDANTFFELNKNKLICLDEVQFSPNIFKEIRGFVDQNPNTKFLILGSSSPELLRQSAESLAGRIFYYELTPFLWTEILDKIEFNDYWFKGGYPRSVLNDNDFSTEWLRNYIKTFLERDVRQFGYNIPPENLKRLWTMLAHLNGQLLNYELLAQSLGVSAPTVKSYIDILEHTFMIRRLAPYHSNSKKRLQKSPKLYIRDTGILHNLLGIVDFNNLYSHPAYGFSWETMVIENVINKYKGYSPYFYRTSNGNELDLILVKGQDIIAIEIKATSVPKLSIGFWNAIADIKPTNGYVIAQVAMSYPLKNSIMVHSLQDFLKIDD